MDHLDMLCLDAKCNWNELVNVSQEVLLVTMEGVLNYPVLQQGKYA
jgi:hypothetical protein